MGDFKFLSIVIIFLSLFTLIGGYIALDDSFVSNDLTGEYNNTVYTDSTNTNNFDVLKSQFSNMENSNLIILVLIGSIVAPLFIFVILRFIRGQ